MTMSPGDECTIVAPTDDDLIFIMDHCSRRQWLTKFKCGLIVQSGLSSCGRPNGATIVSPICAAVEGDAPLEHVKSITWWAGRRVEQCLCEGCTAVERGRACR